MPRVDDHKTSEEAYGQGKSDAEGGKSVGDNMWERAAQDLPTDIIFGGDNRTDNEKSYDKGLEDGQ